MPKAPTPEIPTPEIPTPEIPTPEIIVYHDRDTALNGMLIRPAAPPRGVIVVFPNIANLGPHAIAKAQSLANMGFVAFIADFYGQQPENFEASRPLAQALRADVDHYRTRLRAAVTAARALPGCAGLPLAAIGFCMGGQAVLELARDGADLALIASFHGLFDTARPAAPGQIRARILICHGDADPMAPRAAVLSFWEEMDAAGANWHFHAYAGVRHGFTDPASDARAMPAIAYNASADRQSWAALTALLDEVIPA